MNDLFHSAKLRLSRGEHHIFDLETRIRAFLEGKPYTISRETKPETIQDLFKISIKFTKSIPEDFAPIAADAVDNLRSALDHAWYAIAHASGAIKANQEAYFPIANSLRRLDINIREIRRKSQGFPDDILTLLRAFHPYKGGNDFIWALNRICVINKHRMIAPIGIASGAIVQYPTPHGTVRERRILQWNRRKNEIIFFVFERDAQIEHNINIALDIAFHEAPVAYQRPVLGTLKHMASKVKHILEALEGAARTLGFNP